MLLPSAQSCIGPVSVPSGCSTNCRQNIERGIGGPATAAAVTMQPSTTKVHCRMIAETHIATRSETIRLRRGNASEARRIRTTSRCEGRGNPYKVQLGVPQRPAVSMFRGCDTGAVKTGLRGESACRWFDSGPGHHFQLDDLHAVPGIARGPSGPSMADPRTIGRWVGRDHFAPLPSAGTSKAPTAR